MLEALLTLAWETGCPVRSASDETRRVLRRENVVTTDRFVDGFHGDGATASNLQRILAALPAGTTELMCHPGIFDDDLAYSRYGRQRETELAALCDPEARATIERLDIRLCHFGALDAAG